jgi:hypothetical protein
VQDNRSESGSFFSSVSDAQMRTAVFAILVVLGLCATARSHAGQSMFVYHNNFWLNLHEFLRGETYRRSAKLPPEIAPSSLTGSERAAWESAIEVYTEVAKRDRVLDEESRRITNALSTTGNATRLREGLLDARVTHALNDATPIYRARLWAARRRGNDDWNEWAKTLTDRHQAAMAAALAKAYGITWPPEPYLVDAVGESGGNPAFTQAPASSRFAAHIHANVGDFRNTGSAPLELMFLEASHVAAVGGHVARLVEEACERQKLAVPPDLWHFMIMFTTGEVARRELERSGSFGYVPYVYRYNQLPPAVLSAFEQQWLPYLDGKISFEKALSALVRTAR